MLCNWCDREIEDVEMIVEDVLLMTWAYHVNCAAEITAKFAASGEAQDIYDKMMTADAGEVWGEITAKWVALQTLELGVDEVLAILNVMPEANDDTMSNAIASLTRHVFPQMESLVGRMVLTLDMDARMAWQMTLRSLGEAIEEDDLRGVIDKAGDVETHVMHMMAPFLRDTDPASWFVAQDVDKLTHLKRMNDELMELASTSRVYLPGRSAADEAEWREHEPVDEFVLLRMSPYWSVGPIFAVMLGSLVKFGSNRAAINLVNGIEGEDFLAWFNRYLFSVERLMSAANQAIDEGVDRANA